MFSAKIYIKHVGTDLREEQAQDGSFIGTYKLKVPVRFYRDPLLSNDLGFEQVFEFDGLTIDQCTPEYIY